MTLELEPYYQNLRAAKGRSASISVPACAEMETTMLGSSSGVGPDGRGSHSRFQLPTGNSRTGSAADFNEHTAHYGSRGSGGNMQILNNGGGGGGGGGGTPRPRKTTGTHRSQSARVVGHNRPKVKRREHDISEYQQHLDLASSEGAIRDCQESYNPFISGSTGRLVTSTSLEMSQNSLHHGTPPPSNNVHLSTDAVRDSPVIIRRHSGAGNDRRGSADQKSTPDRERLCLGGYGGGIPNIIPTIATPEASPHPQRKGMTQQNAQQQQHQQQQQQHGSGNKPVGLPKTPSPSVSRSGSQRRVNSVKAPKRGMDRYLDVPSKDSQPSPEEEDDEESYRLRTFNVTSKGIVNRGDSFRRRRSRSNSLVPTPTTPEAQRNMTFMSEDGLLLPHGLERGGSCRVSPAGSRQHSPRPSLTYTPSPNRSPRPSLTPGSPNRSPRPSLTPQPPSPPSPTEPPTSYRVGIVGARGVGKSSLLAQFLTSESINAYDRPNDIEGEETVSVMLNNEESEITFFKMNDFKTEFNRMNPPDGFLLVYSVVDRASFQRVETELRKLQEIDFIRTKAVVIVANKIDLARSRSVSAQDGRCLAVSYRAKFAEISVGINHNVDELLVGLLHQIRLKCEQTGGPDTWSKHRGVWKASVKARQMLTWLLGKEDSKFKNCENLHIL